MPVVRFLRLALVFAPILLAMQGWVPAQGSVTDTIVEILPPNPTSSDSISIRLSGQWSGCHPGNPKASIAAQSIRIDTSSPGEVCVLAFTPWRLTVFVGRLPAGAYDVTATYTGTGFAPKSIIARVAVTVTLAEDQDQRPWLGQNPARKEMAFPFFIKSGPSNNGYNSAFEVINPNLSSAIVSFSFFSSTGKPVLTVAASGQGTLLGSAQLRIDGNAIGRINFVFPGSGDFTGSAFVGSTQPVIVQEEISHYVLEECVFCLAPPFTKLKSRILVPAPLPERRQVLRVKFNPTQPWTNTAVAVVFSWNPAPPGALAALRAVGKLTFRSDSGVVLVEKTVTLGVNEQLIGFITDLIPEIATTGISGSLELVCDQEIFLTAVQVTTSGQEETWEWPNSGAAAHRNGASMPSLSKNTLIFFIFVSRGASSRGAASVPLKALAACV